MKVLVVGAWQPRCLGDERARRLPPLTVVHLAGLCPDDVEVEVWHEQARPFQPEEVDADLVAITAHTSNAERAYGHARELRERGIAVVLGGPHVTLVPDDARPHADAIVTGEGDRVFPRLIDDFGKGRLESVYAGGNLRSLEDLPTPRYDLFEDHFPLRCYVQATRGCPWVCTFCALKAWDRSFRVRPVDDVIRDITRCEGSTFLQKKFVWFWDDNLIGNRPFARELFRRLRPLNKWWWSQVSIDLAKDEETLRLAAESGCAAVFVGIETFSEQNLQLIRKRQNKAARYRDAIRAFHDHGIAVNAGIIVGLDEDTPASIRRIPEIVDELGIDLPFVNILTPFERTPLRDSLRDEGRLLGRPWAEHNSVSVTYDPKRMSVDELESAYWETRRRLYSVPRFMRRFAIGASRLRLGALVMSAYSDFLISTGNFRRPDGPHPVVDGRRPTLGPWEAAAPPLVPKQAAAATHARRQTAVRLPTA